MAEAGKAAPPRRDIVWYVSRTTDLIAALMLLLLCLVTVIDVTGRDVFRRPMKGADELTVIFMAVSTYAVFFTVTWRQEHVCVDLIDLVYPKSNFWIGLREIAIHIAAAGFMVLVTQRLWVLAGRYVENAETYEYTGLAKWPFLYFFTAMCALAIVALAINAVRYAIGRGPMQRQTSELEIGKHRID